MSLTTTLVLVILMLRQNPGIGTQPFWPLEEGSVASWEHNPRTTPSAIFSSPFIAGTSMFPLACNIQRESIVFLGIPLSSRSLPYPSRALYRFGGVMPSKADVRFWPSCMRPPSSTHAWMSQFGPLYHPVLAHVIP
jgi:hypothetical protein